MEKGELGRRGGGGAFAPYSPILRSFFFNFVFDVVELHTYVRFFFYIFPFGVKKEGILRK